MHAQFFTVTGSVLVTLLPRTLAAGLGDSNTPAHNAAARLQRRTFGDNAKMMKYNIKREGIYHKRMDMEIQAVEEDAEAETETEVKVVLQAPNTVQGDNTPDNVAPGTWTEDNGCVAYYAVVEGNTCNDILSAHSTSFSTDLDTFYHINPSIKDDCTNLIPGWAYCLAVATPANVAPDTFTVEDGCTRYQTVEEGDICLALVALNTAKTDITLEDFYTANPDVDGECSNLAIGVSYCVGVKAAAVAEEPVAVVPVVEPTTGVVNPPVQATSGPVDAPAFEAVPTKAPILDNTSPQDDGDDDAEDDEEEDEEDEEEVDCPPRIKRRKALKL